MSSLEVQTMSGGSNTAPNGKAVNVKLAVDPSSSPDAVHRNGDLKMSQDSMAPPVQHPYNMANSMVDLPCAAYALELFLASHMLESEEYMNQSDPKK